MLPLPLVAVSQVTPETADIEPSLTDLTVEVSAEKAGALAPLAGATIVATSWVGYTTTGKSDEAGRAVLANLVNGIVVLTVTADGFEDDTSSVQLTQDRQNVRVTLFPILAKLAITVLGVEDDIAVPISGCRVTITPEGGGSRSTRRTDQHGAASVPKLSLGKVTVTVVAAGWETEVEAIRLEKKEAKLEIRLHKQRPPEVEGQR